MSRPSVKAWRKTRLEPAPLAQFQAAEQVLQQPVDAGVADDAEQVQVRPVAPGRCATAAFSSALSKNVAVADLLGDADRLLVDDPARPDVLVADLAVAHRPLGQADVEAAGVDQRRWGTRPSACRPPDGWPGRRRWPGSTAGRGSSPSRRGRSEPQVYWSASQSPFNRAVRPASYARCGRAQAEPILGIFCYERRLPR